MLFPLFEKCFQKLSLSTLSTLTRERSSTRFPALTRLTVHRRRQLVDPTRKEDVTTFGRFCENLKVL
eukprot:7938356-Pyramimonas_sp.AAC.1